MLQCTEGPVVPCDGVRVFPPDPAAPASLLGSNYELLFLSFQGGLLHSLPVTGFTPGEVKFGLLILVCCTFLPHPSSQDRVSGDFALNANVLKVDFCLTPPLSSLLFWLGMPFYTTAGGPSYLLVHDGWHQEEQAFSDIVNCKNFCKFKTQRKDSCLQLLAAVHLAEVVGTEMPFCKPSGGRQAVSCCLDTYLCHTPF